MTPLFPRCDVTQKGASHIKARKNHVHTYLRFMVEQLPKEYFSKG